MSQLETKISELERELALKRGYQAVKFVLPKSLPEDVASEIQGKLREIAEGLALSKEQLKSDEPTSGMAVFTAEETNALKMLAETVLKRTAGTPSTPSTASSGTVATPAPTSQNHVAKTYGSPRKARVLTSENVRGEGKRYVAPEDELYVANPEKVDDHGMISATHMKRGVMIKIPVDDVDFLT